MNPSNKAKTAPTRAAMYIRESSREQGKGFSPKTQEDAVRLYAKNNGITHITKYVDLISGRIADKRIDFLKMIQDGVAGKFDVVLIFHTSRFARNVQDAREYKGILRKNGVDVISVTQPTEDWENPNAFLNEGINELFDEYISRQISFWVRNNLLQKRLQGKNIANPPFGYYKKIIGHDKVRGRKMYDQTWRIHKEQAHWVKTIFRLYASGQYSHTEIAQHLNDHGVKPLIRESFGRDTVKDMLKNRAYLGYITSPRRGLQEVRGPHKPIISQALFDKVQTAKHARRKNYGRPPAKHRTYLLQGIAYCYKCATRKGKKDHQRLKDPKMYCHTHVYKGQETYSYNCAYQKETKKCDQPSVHCEIIDQQVVEFMGGLQLPEQVITETLSKLSILFASSPKTKKSSPTTLQQLEKKRDKLNFAYHNTDQLTNTQYLQRLEDIKAQIEQLHMDDGNLPSGITQQQFQKKVEHFLRNFGEEWTSQLPIEERRAWVQAAIKKVWIKNKKVVGIEPHDDFKPLLTYLQKVGGQAPSITPIKKSEVDASDFLFANKKKYIL